MSATFTHLTFIYSVFLNVLSRPFSSTVGSESSDAVPSHAQCSQANHQTPRVTDTCFTGNSSWGKRVCLVPSLPRNSEKIQEFTSEKERRESWGGEETLALLIRYQLPLALSCLLPVSQSFFALLLLLFWLCMSIQVTYFFFQSIFRDIKRAFKESLAHKLDKLGVTNDGGPQHG